MNSTEKLQAAFHKSLELDPAVEVSDLQYRAIPEWDSIGHMVLVAEIENEFDVMLSTDEVVALSSFPAAVDILKAHGVGEF